jgi:hypothetical protein
MGFAITSMVQVLEGDDASSIRLTIACSGASSTTVTLLNMSALRDRSEDTNAHDNKKDATLIKYKSLSFAKAPIRLLNCHRHVLALIDEAKIIVCCT